MQRFFNHINFTQINNDILITWKFSEFLRINAFRMNYQFREEILEILRFTIRGISAILIFERKKNSRNSVEFSSALDRHRDFDLFKI